MRTEAKVLACNFYACVNLLMSGAVKYYNRAAFEFLLYFWIQFAPEKCIEFDEKKHVH